MLAATFNNQAVLYVLLGNYRGADDVVSRAEGIIRGLAPREQPLVAYTLLARSLVREALAQYDNALTEAGDASAIVEKALGAKHPANVPVLDVLALLTSTGPTTIEPRRAVTRHWN